MPDCKDELHLKRQAKSFIMKTNERGPLHQSNKVCNGRQRAILVIDFRNDEVIIVMKHH